MRPRTAFTLIELLAVITLIGILITLLLPALRQARTAAELAECMVNQRSMATAAVTYATDHRSHFPPAVTKVEPSNPDDFRYFGPHFFNHGADADPERGLGHFLEPYQPEVEVLSCPLTPGIPSHARRHYREGNHRAELGQAFLWNWPGATDPATGTRLAAASTTDAMGEARVLLGDRITFNGPPGLFQWRSPHPIPGGVRAWKNDAPDTGWIASHWVGTASPPPDPPRQVFHFAYRDGSVRRWPLDELVPFNMNIHTQIELYLPPDHTP